jgi:hypothetical protein
MKKIDRLRSLLVGSFPYLYVTTNALLVLETATYHGFVRKFLFFDVTFLFFLTLLVDVYLVSQSIFYRRKATSLTFIDQLIVSVNRLSLIPLLLTYYVLANLEVTNFPNYVFSHFHINPENLMNILVFNILVFCFELLRSTKLSQELYTILHRRFGFELNSSTAIQLFFFGALLFFIVPQMQYDFNYTYINTVRTLQTFGQTYDQKMVFMLGGKKYTGWIYAYGQFVNTHTPKDAVIFIPPQEESWQMEGNQYYFRWFVYPRKLVTSQDIQAPIPEGATHVLIAYGSWPWGVKEYGWPRIKIPADRIKRIILVNRETDEIIEKTDTDYIHHPSEQLWGVIELK